MDSDAVTVGTFRFVYEAELARLHLEEAGIRGFITDAEVVNMDWFLGNAVGYVKVQVARHDAETAVAILAEKLPVPSAAANAEDDTTTCLACGTTLPPGDSTCPTCGWSYGDMGDEA